MTSVDFFQLSQLQLLSDLYKPIRDCYLDILYYTIHTSVGVSLFSDTRVDILVFENEIVRTDCPGIDSPSDTSTNSTPFFLFHLDNELLLMYFKCFNPLMAEYSDGLYSGTERSFY